MPRLTVIVPVYNEAGTVRTALDKLRTASFPGFEREFVVVDDGSTDATPEVLARLEPPFRVITHACNRGKGAAVRTGLAQGQGDFFAILDADLEYDPSDLAELLERLVEDDVDVVFGSRFSRRNEWRPISPLQHLAHELINAASARCSGLRLEDPTSCQRVFRRGVRDHLLPRLKAERFTLEVEMVAHIARAGFRTLEVPVHYRPRTYRDGKKIRWTDGVSILGAILRHNLL